MEYKKIELKKGINFHIIKTDRFKTNLLAIFLTTKLDRRTVTKNALIPSVLRRGSKNMMTQEQISKELEEMYGAGFDCGVDKTGDNQVLKFYIETINDNYLPQKNENMLKTSLDKLLEIVFNPLTENNSFIKEYVEQEKNNLKNIIETKIDNKSRYALDRCIEEMYKNEPYGLYKFGNVENLKEIDEKNLYEYYKELVSNCKIDIFLSGNIENNIVDEINENENIKLLKERESIYEFSKLENKKTDKEKIIIESMEVTQGKLVIGLNINIRDEKQKYDALMYNMILGGSATSKMFQNIREKEHLAYVASSMYIRHKNNIFMNCGIEIDNYEKTVELAKKQLEDMKKGDFTEEEIENAKKGIIASIKGIEDEQDTILTYYFGQELTENKVTLEEYKEIIEKVTKDKILEIAKNIEVDTIYFLKN